MHSDTQSRPRHSHTHARRLCKCKNEIERSKNRKVENLIYWSGNTHSILPLNWQPATPRTWHFALSSQQRTKWIIIILLRISLLSSSKWTNALSFALSDPNRQSNLKLCVCTRRLSGDGDACSLWECTYSYVYHALLLWAFRLFESRAMPCVCCERYNYPKEVV